MCSVKISFLNPERSQKSVITLYELLLLMDINNRRECLKAKYTRNEHFETGLVLQAFKEESSFVDF